MDEIKLNKDETIYLFDLLYNFYNDINNIEDYYIIRKKERVINLNINKYKENLFNDFNISPNDLDISIEIIDEKTFNEVVQSIVSIPLETQIGRRLNILVKDNTTSKWLGFIRICSPIAGIKPRTELLGDKLDLQKVNNHIFCGSVIVPIQPFGYNYLGGKLLALICLSNEVREMFNNKYKSNILLFETTSLYGDLKQSSQYDGLEPYIKKAGKTSADMLLFPNDDVYFPFRNLLRKYYGQEKWNGSIATNTSSAKFREFTKGLQLLTLHIKLYYPELLGELDTLKLKIKVKSKKNYYYSKLVFDNSFNVMTKGDDVVIKDKQKFDLSSLVIKWKSKSEKRWNKLKKEDKLKNNLELYTTEILNNKLDFGIVNR
jgi:hypothetical protein